MPKIIEKIIALLGLIVLSPLLIIITIIIKITSKGPIFFKQKRVGKLKKVFNIYKFRTMVINAELEGSISLGKKDKRITKIGEVLRKSKLDELPQLINILKGEMSFVGPRPDTPEYTKYYEKVDMKYFEMLPGITSKASIIFSNEEELMAMQSDPHNFYIETIIPQKAKIALVHLNKSFLSDINYILKTLLKIVKK